jgi:hypothetical protein
MLGGGRDITLQNCKELILNMTYLYITFQAVQRTIGLSDIKSLISHAFPRMAKE